MRIRSFRAGRSLLVAFVVALCAAGIAAVAAHFAIDWVGDFAIQHDAYDDVREHASRGVVLLGVLSLLIGASVRLVFATTSSAARRQRLRLALAAPASPTIFILGVIALSVILLMGMESVDVLAATGRLESLDDALGGSPLLGAGILLPIAALFGSIAWRGLRWLCASRDAIIHAIVALFCAGRRPPKRPSARTAYAAPPARKRTTVVRQAAKRGPPLPAPI